MRKKQFTRDFDHYIDAYMYNCRNLKAFFTWYADTKMTINPMEKFDNYIMTVSRRDTWKITKWRNC